MPVDLEAMEERLAAEEWAQAPRSVSQVEEYEACPYRSFLKRVKGVTLRPAAWSAQGTAFHKAAEVFEKSSRAMGVEETVGVFQDTYSVLINNDLAWCCDFGLWMRANRGGTVVQDVEDRYRAGCEQTRRYVEYVLDNRPELWYYEDRFPAVELGFTAVFGGVPFRGIIDQVIVNPDGSLRVRDLKTGSTRSRFQLWVYGLGLQQAFPGVSVTVGDWYLAREGRVSREVSMEGADVEEITERVVEMDRGVKERVFPPRPGRGCWFCEVSHKCEFSRC